MRRSLLWTCALLGIATFGCKQINDQVAKIKAKIAAARHRPAPARPTPAAPATPAPAPATPPPTPPAPPPPRPAATTDVPYTSPDTGTIAPGMGEKDVYTLWGPPAAVRRQGEFTYLFFRNGCEHSCGTEDVVTLQNGQVVDAVLRWPGHRYSGESSSPAATRPHMRRGGGGGGGGGGDTLTAKPPTP